MHIGKYFIFQILIFISFNSFAIRPLAVSGRVMNAAGSPVNDPNTTFKIDILNSGSCVLYEETQTLDMTYSNGYFDLAVFNGNQTFSSNNPANLFGTGVYACQDGTTWNGFSTDTRTLQVSFQVGMTGTWQIFYSSNIDSAVYADQANQLGGLLPNQFIQVSGVTNQSVIDSLSSQVSTLLSLAAGTSNLYAQSASVSAALNSKQNSLSYVPMNPSNNLSDLKDPIQSRQNLGLGSLSTLNIIGNSNITDLDWSKLDNKPSLFPPLSHSHVISDIINLQATLDTKMQKTDFNCSPGQSLSYNSVTNVFTCVGLQMTGDISGPLSNNLLLSIQGIPLSISNLADQQVISYNQSLNAWTNESLSFGGDISGSFNSVQINKIQSFPISISSANLADGQVLAYNQSLNQFQNTSVNPNYPGQVLTFATENCPTGTLRADGSTYAQTQYVDLYNALGCTYGCPTATTFNVPNYQGLFLRGAQSVTSTTNFDPDFNSRQNGTPTFKVGSFQNFTVERHTHHDQGHNHTTSAAYNQQTQDHWASAGSGSSLTGNDPLTSSTGYANLDYYGGNETRPVNIYVNYCISAFKNGSLSQASNNQLRPVSMNQTNTSNNCSNSNKGSVMFNFQTKKIQYCDGSSWINYQ